MKLERRSKGVMATRQVLYRSTDPSALVLILKPTYNLLQTDQDANQPYPKCYSYEGHLVLRSWLAAKDGQYGPHDRCEIHRGWQEQKSSDNQ